MVGLEMLEARVGFEPTNGGFADLVGFAILLIRLARYPASLPLFLRCFAIFVLRFVLRCDPASPYAKGARGSPRSCLSVDGNLRPSAVYQRM